MDRRRMLGFLAAAGAIVSVPRAAHAQEALARAIPASGERLPVVGLGTWITFDVTEAAHRRARGEILRAFLAAGGRLVDSSPMYGASEETIGAELSRGIPPGLFAATKVWTVGG